jgi:hypothetical protein
LLPLGEKGLLSTLERRRLTFRARRYWGTFVFAYPLSPTRYPRFSTSRLMTDTDFRILVENYLAAFAAPAPAEQQRLLQASVAPEIVFTNPGVNGQGFSTLLAHIAGFQQKFPGGRFRLNWVRHQHGQMLAEWTQLDQQGVELLTAHSYAQVNDAGRLTHWAGFWQTGAV